MSLLFGGEQNSAPGKHSRSADLCERIIARDVAAEAELYALIGRALKARVYREFSMSALDLEDLHHDVFIDVLGGIRAGTLRNPGSLVAYSITVIARRKGDWIAQQVRARKRRSGLDFEPIDSRDSVEENIERSQRIGVATALMNRLSPAQREILERFYLAGETREAVMVSMGLTDTQYRLSKNRALRKLGQHVATTMLSREQRAAKAG